MVCVEVKHYPHVYHTVITATYGKWPARVTIYLPVVADDQYKGESVWGCTS